MNWKLAVVAFTLLSVTALAQPKGFIVEAIQ